MKKIQMAKHTGKRFGRLLVVRPDVIIKGKQKYLCLCDCGNEKIIGGNELQQGTIISCGCYRKQKIRERFYKGSINISGARWYRIKKNAEIRNIPFLITLEQAEQLLSEQDFSCYFTGANLISCQNTKSITDRDWTISLDRKDPKKDYSIDNCCWVHKDINIIKHTCNEKEFLQWAKSIFKFVNNTNKNQNNIIINNYKGNFKGYANVGTEFLSNIKHNAIYKNYRNLEVDITEKDIWEQYIKQDGLCAISGVCIEFAKPGYRWFTGTCSIDRIDGNIGYTKENIQVVHKQVNLMRKDFTINQFIEYMIKIVNHRKLI